MDEIKGKYIKLVASRMSVTAEREKFKAEEEMNWQTGKSLQDIDDEEFYDVEKTYLIFLKHLERSEEGAEKLRALGREVYPAIKATTSSLERIDNPLDMLKSFPREYAENNRGDSTGGYRVEKAQEGKVVITGRAPRPCIYIQGILEGVLRMFGKKGKVEELECCRRSGGDCRYRITWE